MNTLSTSPETDQTTPRVLLVGAGDAGLHHAKALHDLRQQNQLQWVGSVTSSDDTYQDFCSKVGAKVFAPRFESIDSFLDQHSDTTNGLCDIAIIATPDNLHYDHITKYLGSGISVLAEKPLVQTVTEANQCVLLARQHNVLLRTGYQHRYHAGHVALKQLLATSDWPIEHIELSWSWPDPKRSGWRANPHSSLSWAMAALGTHLVDFATWLTNDTLTDIRARSEPSHGPDQVTDVHARIGDNTSLHLATSINTREPSKVFLYGKHQLVSCLGTFGARGTGVISITNKNNPAYDLKFTPQNPYTAQLHAFINEHRRGYTNDASLVENVRVLQTIQSKRST